MRDKEFKFYMNFRLVVDSVAAIAQSVATIVTIFFACTMTIYGSNINPKCVDLIRVGDKVNVNFNSMV